MLGSSLINVTGRAKGDHGITKRSPDFEKELEHELRGYGHHGNSVLIVLYKIILKYRLSLTIFDLRETSHLPTQLNIYTFKYARDKM